MGANAWLGNIFAFIVIRIDVCLACRREKREERRNGKRRKKKKLILVSPCVIVNMTLQDIIHTSAHTGFLDISDCNLPYIYFKLPSTLTELDCSHNPFTSLPPLPPSLRVLRCSHTCLLRVSDLPPTLEVLDCSNTYLSDLPVLPDSLRTIVCADVDWNPAFLRSLKETNNVNEAALLYHERAKWKQHLKQLLALQHTLDLSEDILGVVSSYFTNRSEHVGKQIRTIVQKLALPV